jgi:copper chaperone CopZ
VPEVHVYITKPPEKDVPALEDIGDALRRLSHVSGVEVDPTGSVVAVSFEGRRDEQQEIERVIEEAGYEVSRLSVRSDDFPRE